MNHYKLGINVGLRRSIHASEEKKESNDAETS